MEIDQIKEVYIDSSGRLFVQPQSKAFPYIYREAMEVSWDSSAQALHGPVPREWSYSQWFLQILSAAKEQGCVLALSANKHWRNIPALVKEEIQAAFSESAA